MKTITTHRTRKPTHRALADWRTIFAARSGASSLGWADSGAENRAAGAASLGGRRAGRRCSGSRPGWSVIGLLGGWSRGRAGLDAARRALRRDDPGLADGDGQRP